MNTLTEYSKEGLAIQSIVHSKVAIPIITGIAGLAAMIIVAFVLAAYPKQEGDLDVSTPLVNTVAPETADLISSADAIEIALKEAGLVADSDKIEHMYVDRFYVDEMGRVYNVNPVTLEMTSADDKSRIVENLAKFDRATHYWVISLYTGIDSGYIVTMDASGGSVVDKSPYTV